MFQNKTHLCLLSLLTILKYKFYIWRWSLQCLFLYIRVSDGIKAMSLLVTMIVYLIPSYATCPCKHFCFYYHCIIRFGIQVNFQNLVKILCTLHSTSLWHFAFVRRYMILRKKTVTQLQYNMALERCILPPMPFYPRIFSLCCLWFSPTSCHSLLWSWEGLGHYLVSFDFTWFIRVWYAW